MKKVREQSPVQRFFASRLFIILGLVCVLLITTSYIRGYYQDYKIQEEIRTLQGEISQLEKKKIESLEILQYVMSPDFVEEKARTEFGMKKPGERVIVLADESGERTPVERREEGGQDLNNIRKWWYYFTHTTP
jgi:cell division protein FtsB